MARGGVESPRENARSPPAAGAEDGSSAALPACLRPRAIPKPGGTTTVSGPWAAYAPSRKLAGTHPAQEASAGALRVERRADGEDAPDTGEARRAGLRTEREGSA